MIHIDLDPILLRLGPFALSWHGLWLTACIVLGYLVATREARRNDIKSRHYAELASWVIVLGYVGARLVHVLDEWAIYAAQPSRILSAYRGGLAAYGALIGGGIAAALYCWRRRLSLLALGDSLAVAMPLGEMVGRIGCLISGDAYGLPTEGRWGLVYWHPGTALPVSLLGVPTFPAPLVLQVWNTLVFLLLLRLRGRLPLGTLLPIWMLLYAAGRFVVAFWQHGNLFLFGLKQVQILSIGAAGLAFVALLYLRLSAPRATASAASRPPR